MKRRDVLGISAISVLALAMLPSGAAGQQKSLKEQIVGTWAYVSADTVAPDGKRTPTFGPNPSGLTIFGADGRYISFVIRADVPKFASDSRTSGTAAENMAVVQGGIATFGRYSINEADHILTLNIERSSFPNWNGVEQKRPVTITADELKYVVPVASGGGGRGEVTLKRVK
jgi:hypothetical protein